VQEVNKLAVASGNRLTNNNIEEPAGALTRPNLAGGIPPSSSRTFSAHREQVSQIKIITLCCVIPIHCTAIRRPHLTEKVSVSLFSEKGDVELK
jgi:hypothetical protein